MTSAQRLMAELSVIVVGVLIALGAEAGWSARSDRAREREILHDLSEEFAQNARILQSDIEANQLALEAGLLWEAAMLGERETSRDSLVQLFVASRIGARFDPVTGVLQSVLMSGDLPIIRNTELRQALAGWPDRAEEARSTSEDVNTQRSNWASFLATLEPGGDLSAAEVALIRLDASRSDSGGFQLHGLAAFVDSIRGLIDAELARQ